MALSWADGWSLAAIVGSAAIALTLLAFGFSRRVNRAFALFLVVGLGHAITSLVYKVGAPEASELAARLYPYFNFTDELALLWFLSVFTGWPRRLHQGPWMAIIFLTAACALVGAYMVDPDLYFVGSQGRTAVPFEAEGPLAIADSYLWISHTIVAFALAISYFRSNPTSRSPSTILVSVALAIVSAAWIPSLAVASLRAGRLPVPASISTSWLAHGALFLALVAYLGWQAMRHEDAPARAAARRYALVLTALIAFGSVERWLPPWKEAIFGALSMASTLLVAHSLVRHQLFGLDRKVRFVLSRSTIAAAFVAAFFLASEGAQLVFGREDQLIGLLAAGALVFALAPLQRAAERLAERAVPSGQPRAPPAPLAGDRHAIVAYRAALTAAWRDGQITPEEELELARLADRLGLPASVVVEVRHEAERSSGRRQP